MKTRTTVVTFAAIGLLMLAGCATTSDTTDDTDSGSSDTGSEFNQGETPVSDTVTDASSGSMQLGTAYFDFDRAEIRGDMRAVLKANAEVLQSSNGTAVIEGHADERGSEEYNLALGERRAEAVRKYLAALGVSTSQMRIVSYGEAKPASTGHDESAWQLNRRAEFSMR
ncbi:MAG: peptidoglycan-associated lipoprotein Pal [Deltaproteobacteria bacterium]|jgi:peptidoglycan-associated lipoprotein|nr:peptidoglycan-associated lipoprotein Pal [Deltaproteobacteria bacterium]